ncbi:hypothetical protein [Embleya scabrispora]|uniref:hypothetical protein n=1 Tax=Embleya scabrispora TaxID=159449 RepID=UPI001319C77E|nr:hypothetical protein [Embleya scabrispora]MYS82160.1 hypothetical protein [Streptomyces sp. SID5474]
MTVTSQQPPTEAEMRQRLSESDEVQVTDVRSGCVGTLYRVKRRRVVALLGSMEFRIPFERLAVVDDERQDDEAASSSSTP